MVVMYIHAWKEMKPANAGFPVREEEERGDSQRSGPFLDFVQAESALHCRDGARLPFNGRPAAVRIIRIILMVRAILPATLAGRQKTSPFDFEWRKGMIFPPVEVNGSRPWSFVLDTLDP